MFQSLTKIKLKIENSCQLNITHNSHDENDVKIISISRSFCTDVPIGDPCDLPCGKPLPVIWYNNFRIIIENLHRTTSKSSTTDALATTSVCPTITYAVCSCKSILTELLLFHSHETRLSR